MAWKTGGKSFHGAENGVGGKKMGIGDVFVLLCRNVGREDGCVWKKEEEEMLGIESPSVWLAYALSLAGAALCVGYGIANWNKGEEPVKKEDVDWAKEEKAEVEDAL